jgi:VanZ family protein
MTAPRAIHAPPAFLGRRSLDFLTLLAVLFVAQAGLIPFDFGLGAGGPFFEARLYDLIIPDIVSNLALYVPLGALCCWALERRLGNVLVAAVGAVVLAAVLSLVVEYAQAFSPSRVSSLIDLTSNVTGAAIGALFSFAARWVVPRLAAAVRFELHHRPPAAILKAYCAVLFIAAAIPFSFSFDVGGLKSAVKSVNLIPFAPAGSAAAYPAASVVRRALGVSPPARARSPADSQGAAGTTDAASRPSLYAAWSDARRWSRWAAEAASFFFLAGLLLPVLGDDYGFRRPASIVLALWSSCLLAGALSLMQLFVVSRACDVTDMLFRVAGAALGLAVSRSRPRFEPRAIHGTLPASPLHATRWRRAARIGCLGSAMYILYTGVIPLDYSWQWDRVLQSLSAPGFMPFYGYFTGRFDLMWADFVEKLTAYLVLSALLVAMLREVGGRSLRAGAAAAFASCLALALLIEVVQVFSPIRVTSLTDPIVALVGAGLGVLAQEQARRFYRNALRVASAEPQPERPQPRAAALSPLDELIGTLTEPREGAPAEPDRPRPAAEPTTNEHGPAHS